MEIYHFIWIGFPIVTTALILIRQKEIRRERREGKIPKPFRK